MSLFKITIKAGNPAVFDPNPLTAQANDGVFWFNSDPKNAHWPAPSVAHTRFPPAHSPIRFLFPRSKPSPTFASITRAKPGK